MKFRFVDLSVPLEPVPKGQLPEQEAMNRVGKIEYIDHEHSAETVANIFGCEKEDLPGGLGWGNEAMQVGTHSATHVDAPYHFYPTCGGKPAPKIDELPLDWFWGPAVVLDLRHISAGRAATRYDIRAALDDIGYALRPGDIVCLMFGADRLYGTKNYWYQFPGIGADAVRFIVESGVRVIGTDAYGFDVPFEVAKARFAETGDPTLIWEAHRVGMELCYSHIEKMAHLEEMPPLGAYLSCFPVNIRHASAGWTRCVGFIPEEPF